MDEISTIGVNSEAQMGAIHLDVGIGGELLRGASIGRRAVLVEGWPQIFPVNDVVDHGTVVFRTAPGIKLTDGGPVAFEIDALERSSKVADPPVWDSPYTLRPQSPRQ